MGLATRAVPLVLCPGHGLGWGGDGVAGRVAGLQWDSMPRIPGVKGVSKHLPGM